MSCSRRRNIASLALLVALICGRGTVASADGPIEAPGGDPNFSEYGEKKPHFDSPEVAALELHVGMYQPDRVPNGAFQSFYGGDQGPLVGGEVDVQIWRIPYVGLLGAGGVISWARYSGRALLDTGLPSDEKSTLTLYPLAVLAVLRVDALARFTKVPLVFAGKFGADLVPWNSQTGGSSDGSGFSVGTRWAAQVAIELDFLEPRSARRMHEVWGINHSYLFFEATGSTSYTSLQVGDRFAWTAGLGLIL